MYRRWTTIALLVAPLGAGLISQAVCAHGATQVAAKEAADLPGAAHHARAVIAVLQEAVTTGEIEDVRAQLPESYMPLFEAGSEGEMDMDA